MRGRGGGRGERGIRVINDESVLICDFQMLAGL